VREQVEALEHHADLGTHLVDLAQVVGQLDAVHHDAPALVRFQPVDAADQGGLAGPGRAADHDLLALRHRQVDVLEHLEGAVPLVDADNLDRGRSARGLRRRVGPGPGRARGIVSHAQVWRGPPMEAMQRRPLG
jgi:hypothetical protein